MKKIVLLVLVALTAQAVRAIDSLEPERTLLPLSRGLNPSPDGDYKNARFISMQEEQEKRAAIQKANIDRLELELAKFSKTESKTELRPQPSRTLLPHTDSQAKSVLPTATAQKPSIWSRLNPFKKFGNRSTIIRNS